MKAYGREEMQRLDRRSIEEYGIPGVILMENAGLRAADDAEAWMAKRGLGKAVIFCGKGNNGGDGFVVARHLFNRGLPVEVWKVGGDPRPDTDAGLNHRIAVRMGIPIGVAPAPLPVAGSGSLLGEEDAAIDALLGTGLAGEVRDPYRAAIDALNGGPSPIYSIDCPSGLDCDTGEVLGAAIVAERTVTFGAPKRGFLQGEGPRHVGDLVVVDISIPRTLLEEGGEGRTSG